MSKTSFWWKQHIYILENLLDAKLLSKVGQVFNGVRLSNRHQIRKICSWLICLLVILMMWLWNWKLVLATAVGISSIYSIYLFPSRKWQTYWLKWQKFWLGDRRKFTLSVSGGGFAAFSTYMATSIWAESENRWLASAVIFQSFATIFTLVLLIWNFSCDRANRDNHKFDRHLSELTATDPLKRLIAVRQLTHLARKINGDCEHKDRLIEYFRMMLSQEKETIVREAILESLQIWDLQELKLLDRKSCPLPLNFKLSQEKILF
ncbi:MAG: ATP synthase subunit I [Xenococcaceae cyanobacterium]